MHTRIKSVIQTIVFGTSLAVAASTVSAGEIKPAKTFTKPPLGLGADIPDDLLFGGNAAGTPKSRSRVTVRSKATRNRKAKAHAPILSGWEVDDIEVVGDKTWVAAEPIRPGCLDQHAIMSSLSEAGWTEFARHSLRPRTLAFNARRRDGLTKRIQVDRCTGEIIHVSASYTN